MSTPRERIEQLTAEIKKAIHAAKAADARVKQLGDQLMHVLAEARAEAEAARTVVEYPTGRYECAKCRQSTLLTQPARQLPTCDNCGSREWVGHEPTVTKLQAPAPKKYPAGMYTCAKCGIATAVGADTDEGSPCEICGATELKPAP